MTYKKPSSRLLDTIKGKKVKDGGLPLKEFKTQLMHYAINDVETENIYYFSRELLRRYGAKLLYNRYVLSEKQYINLLFNNFGKIKFNETLDAIKF